MKILIVSDSNKHFSDAVDEYIKRLGREVEIIKLKPYKHTDPSIIRKKETEALVSWLQKNREYTILLDVTGNQLDTESFSKYISEKQQSSGKNITFVIGGAYGVDTEDIEKHIDAKLSLSSMTYPHGLALLVLLEQIYRISQIQKGGSYHH